MKADIRYCSIFDVMNKKVIDKSITDFIDLIKENYSDVESVYVFGSYARDNSAPESDIDLAIVFGKLDDTKRFDIQVQLMMLATQIDTRIEPHPISLDDFSSSGNPFITEIKKTGYEIFS